MSQNKTPNSEKEYDYSSKGQQEFLQTEDYNPLTNEAPVTKEYHKVNIAKEDIPNFIPEFDLSVPQSTTFQSSEINSEKEENHSSQSEPQNNYNPAMNDLSSKEKNQAAAVAAETAIQGYEMIWNRFLTPLAQFNSKKIAKSIADGEINPRITIPIDETTEIPIKEFTENFNKYSAEALAVDDGFKERVREPLIRIFEKKGIGMTDEQKIGWEFLVDFGTKTAIVVSMRNDIKAITEDFKERTRLMGKTYVENIDKVDSTIVEPQKTTEIIDKDPEIVRASPLKEIDKEVLMPIDRDKKENVTVSEFNTSMEIIQPGSSPELLKHMEEVSKTGIPSNKGPKQNRNSPAKRTPTSKITPK